MRIPPKAKYRIVRAGSVALACAVAAWAAIHFWPSEEARILRRLDRLAQCVEKDGTENYLTLALKARNLGEGFSDPCRFDVSRAGLEGNVSRDRITALLMQFHSDVSSVSIRFLQRKVEFYDNESAGLLFAAEMRGKLTDGEPFAERHAFVCRLKKEKQWILYEVTMVDTPEK
jgi:hypothetical protein